MKEFVYILPNCNYGVANVVKNLIRYTSRKDIHKKVILIDWEKNGTECASDFGDAEVIVITPGNNWIECKYSLAKKIAKHLSQNSIIVSNDGNPEFAMIELLKLHNPVVAIIHGDNSHYFNGCCRYSYLIDRTICVSSYIERKMIQSVAKNTRPIFIPFPTPAIAPYIKDYSTKLQISYAGSITEAKGCEKFPEVVQQLDKSGIDYLFNIYGDGALLNPIKAAIGNNPNVVFHGACKNKIVLDALLDTHVTIHLSKNEGLPVCLVEAMKSGSVPVVFDLPTGIPDIIDDGVNGFRFMQDDISGVTDKIIELAHNRKLLQEISVNAITKAGEMFNPQVQTEAYEKLFLATESRLNKFYEQPQSFVSKALSRIPFALSYRIQKLLTCI